MLYVINNGVAIFNSTFPLPQFFTQLHINWFYDTTLWSYMLGNLHTGTEARSQTTCFQQADSWQLLRLALRQHKGQLQKQLLIQFSGCKMSAGHCPDFGKAQGNVKF